MTVQIQAGDPQSGIQLKRPVRVLRCKDPSNASRAGRLPQSPVRLDSAPCSSALCSLARDASWVCSCMSECCNCSYSFVHFRLLDKSKASFYFLLYCT